MPSPVPQVGSTPRVSSAQNSRSTDSSINSEFQSVLSITARKHTESRRSSDSAAPDKSPKPRDASAGNPTDSQSEDAASASGEPRPAKTGRKSEKSSSKSSAKPATDDAPAADTAGESSSTDSSAVDSSPGDLPSSDPTVDLPVADSAPAEKAVPADDSASLAANAAMMGVVPQPVLQANAQSQVEVTSSDSSADSSHAADVTAVTDATTAAATVPALTPGSNVTVANPANTTNTADNGSRSASTPAKPVVSALNPHQLQSELEVSNPTAQTPSTAHGNQKQAAQASSLPSVIAATTAATAAVNSAPAAASSDSSESSTSVVSAGPLTDAAANAAVLTTVAPNPSAAHSSTAVPVAAALPLPPELQFAADNHSNILTNIHTKLLPNGGNMEIRLDPPELGALQVSIQMRDGAMTASFQTSNEQATAMLSHSLHQLKEALQSQGVIVDKLQVQQAPRDPAASNQDSQQQQQQQHTSDDSAFQQEQQRRETLRRLWRRLSNGNDPLDIMG